MAENEVHTPTGSPPMPRDQEDMAYEICRMLLRSNFFGATPWIIGAAANIALGAILSAAWKIWGGS